MEVLKKVPPLKKALWRGGSRRPRILCSLDFLLEWRAGLRLLSELPPARLVLPQVSHHALCQLAAVGEAHPLLEQRLHDVGDEPWERAEGMM